MTSPPQGNGLLACVFPTSENNLNPHQKQHVRPELQTTAAVVTQ